MSRASVKRWVLGRNIVYIIVFSSVVINLMIAAGVVFGGRDIVILVQIFAYSTQSLLSCLSIVFLGKAWKEHQARKDQ